MDDEHQPCAPREPAAPGPPPAIGPHGWIILDKPLGLGSTEAVSAVKRAFRQAGLPRPKVGHGGTLDPLATGVLPIALGEATKLAGRMLDAVKAYDFTIAFGIETAGLDAEGDVVARSGHRPAAADVAAVLPCFTGRIDQVPPAYSAIKVDGQRAYARARAGEAVVLPPRMVTIHALEMAGGTGDGPLERITLSATVSKGTYIRSLARDISRCLGTVGHVVMLRRTRAGPFTADQAVGLDRLAAIGQGCAPDLMLPMEAALDDIPALDCTPDMAAAIRQGRGLSGITADDGLMWARDGSGRPQALVRCTGGVLTIERGFNL